MIELISFYNTISFKESAFTLLFSHNLETDTGYMSCYSDLKEFRENIDKLKQDQRGESAGISNDE